MAVSKVKPSAFELQAVSSPVFGGGVPQGRVLEGTLLVRNLFLF